MASIPRTPRGRRGGESSQNQFVAKLSPGPTRWPGCGEKMSQLTSTEERPKRACLAPAQKPQVNFNDSPSNPAAKSTRSR